jgi:tetratricopeptide (TPR) repeat protein
MSLFRFKRRREAGHAGSADDSPNRADAESLLAQADALSEQGRAAEAIALLTDANRARRDGRIERRLALLRYEAFQQFVPPSTPGPWPDVEDRWPEARIPEISAGALTSDTLRSAVQHHGSLIVRGLLPPEQVAALTGDIDRALAAYDARLRDEHDAALADWYEPYPYDTISEIAHKRARGSVMTVESPPALFDLVEVFRATGLDRLAREYFGEAPALLARKATLRRVPPGNFGGWHQDGAFMGEGIRSINVWIALTDCGVDAPGLEVIGRRVDELLPTGNGAFAEWGIKATDAVAYGGDDIVLPRFAAGDAMLFDHMLVHHTAFSPQMTRDRHAIETWMFAPSTYAAMTTAREDGYTPRDQIPIVL